MATKPKKTIHSEEDGTPATPQAVQVILEIYFEPDSDHEGKSLCYSFILPPGSMFVLPNIGDGIERYAEGRPFIKYPLATEEIAMIDHGFIMADTMMRHEIKIYTKKAPKRVIEYNPS
jgi:hypothetical protein